MHYILQYDVIDDYVNRRIPFRDQHLALASAARERGELIMAGALTDPPDQALLVFRDPTSAEHFAAADPYVRNGLIKSWRVRTWATVMGDGAHMPGETHHISGRPDPSEYPPYAQAYIDRVEGSDAIASLMSQVADVRSLLALIDERTASEFRYAPGKWTVKEILGHVNDAERIFAYRLLCVARGETSPLPGFEQDDYIAFGNFNQRTLADHLAEFLENREATIALLRRLPEDAWSRRGTANKYSATVRGIAFLIAGHERHHAEILRTKYSALVRTASFPLRS